MRNASNKSVIHTTYTADYRNQIHFAQRADGQWFMRGQDRTPWGYRWSKWVPVADKLDRATVGCYPRFARLPKN